MINLFVFLIPPNKKVGKEHFYGVVLIVEINPENWYCY